MRAYFIDEIPKSQMPKIRSYLSEKATPSSIEQIFWVKVPDHLLTDLQQRHDGCKPHIFAVEMGPDWIKFELFVRSKKNLRCTCPGYCTHSQIDYVIHFACMMIDELGIAT